MYLRHLWQEIVSVFRGAARDGQGGWRRNQRCLRLRQRRTHAACLKRTWSTVRWNPWWVLGKHSGNVMYGVLVLYQKLWKPLLTTCCMWFQKVNCEPARNGRRSNVLKVAMTFPTKKTGKKRPASEPLPQSKVEESDSEEEENFMVKRALNIKQNKDMVAFLLHFIGIVSSPHYHCSVLIYYLFYSLQSSWRSWTKCPGSSQDGWQCRHPLR